MPSGCILRSVIRQLNACRPKAAVRIFGSQMTKILTPSSDLDIAVLDVPEGDMTTTDLLYELEKAILSKG